jgi:hypothetical protein
MRSFALKGEHKMLRIEKDCDGRVTRLRLIGRIQSDLIAGIQSVMSDCCAHKILDLSEVTLVDLGVVRFLLSCEAKGVELTRCPSCMCKWILRERRGSIPTQSGGNRSRAVSVCRWRSVRH